MASRKKSLLTALMSCTQNGLVNPAPCPFSDRELLRAPGGSVWKARKRHLQIVLFNGFCQGKDEDFQRDSIQIK